MVRKPPPRDPYGVVDLPGYMGIALDEVGEDYYAFRISNRNRGDPNRGRAIALEFSGVEVEGLAKHMRGRAKSKVASNIDEPGFKGVHVDDIGGAFAIYARSEETGQSGYVELPRNAVLGAAAHIEKRRQMLGGAIPEVLERVRNQRIQKAFEMFDLG